MRKRLKTGFTTGTAAAAAAKAAVRLLFTRRPVRSVRVQLLTGDYIRIVVQECYLETENTAVGKVIKDAGDDPDITHRAVIGARITRGSEGDSELISLQGGEGVGTVTKPGLEIRPGEPAINLGPRRMIISAVAQTLAALRIHQPVQVEVFVPEGKRLAPKTLNPRLGIVGGISILGTTGIVKPLSHEAYEATIRSSLSVAIASGLKQVVMTTGRRSERHAQGFLTALAEEAFIQIGDFFKTSLQHAVSMGFDRVILAVFFGKAVKMAQGAAHTHAAKTAVSMEKLSRWVKEAGGDTELVQQIIGSNTAREALDYLRSGSLRVIKGIGDQMIQCAQTFTDGKIKIDGIIFDYDGTILFNSSQNTD